MLSKNNSLKMKNICTEKILLKDGYDKTQKNHSMYLPSKTAPYTDSPPSPLFIQISLKQFMPKVIIKERMN